VPREGLLLSLQTLLAAYQDQRRAADALISRLRRVNKSLNQARSWGAVSRPTLPARAGSAPQHLTPVKYRPLWDTSVTLPTISNPPLQAMLAAELPIRTSMRPGSTT